MIKTENGITEIKGITPEIMADLETVIRCVREALVRSGLSAEDADEEIDKCVKYSKQDITKGIIDKVFGELLQDILGGGKNEN